MAYVRQATHDALTGCKNRRAFDSDIAELLNAQQPFALALVDIDNFKSINDTLGHLTGDIVLRNVARKGSRLCSHITSRLPLRRRRVRGNLPAEQIGLRSHYWNWRTAVEKRVWREENLRVTFSGLGVAF
jgi:hypothetical protein